MKLARLIKSVKRENNRILVAYSSSLGTGKWVLACGNGDSWR